MGPYRNNCVLLEVLFPALGSVAACLECRKHSVIVLE